MKRKIAGFVLIFLHLVGIAGTLYPETRNLTLSLTPINLTVSVLFLVYFHLNEKRKLLQFFVISFLIGFSLEVIGVATGFPFGSYTYLTTLGLKVLEVPLVIGLNWFMLAFIFGNIFSYLTGRNMISAVLASLSMTFLDVLIEPVAIKLDYWVWDSTSIPLSNYLAWFVISIFIQYFYKKLNIRNFNPISVYILIAQILYFASVLLFL
jgi:putative membrane protein